MSRFTQRKERDRSARGIERGEIFRAGKGMLLRTIERILLGDPPDFDGDRTCPGKVARLNAQCDRFRSVIRREQLNRGARLVNSSCANQLARAFDLDGQTVRRLQQSDKGGDALA